MNTINMNIGDHKLDRVFQALSDSTRRQILMRIRENDETVNEIASRFEVSLPAISKHLKVLERAGLISRRKEGQKRFCHAEPAIIEDATAWLEYYQEFWNERLESLRQFIEKSS